MDTWLADDGGVLSYERIGTGPPVILVHGGFTDSRGLEPLAAALAPSRTAVRYDRRGRGASAPYAAGHDLHRDIGDLVGLVDVLADELGPVVLVGHSAGCHVALGAALRGSATRGLLLYEPPTFHHPSVDDETWRRLDAAAAEGDRVTALQVLVNDVIGRSTGVHVSDEELPRVLEDPVARRMLDCVLVAPTEQRAYEAHQWRDDDLAVLDVPTLGVVGTSSPPFLRLFVDRLAGLSSRAEIRLLDHADHRLPEVDPERLVPLILGL